MSLSQNLIYALCLLLFMRSPALFAQTKTDTTHTAQEPVDTTPDQSARRLLKTKIKPGKTGSDHFYTISTYRPNYFLPAVHAQGFNRDIYQASDELIGDVATLKDIEARFQFSIKIPLARGILLKEDSIFFGFTHRAYWQVYSTNNSRPFRENVYSPEIFWRAPVEFVHLPVDLGLVGFGVAHESNGRSGTLSRSWDRLYTVLALEKGNWIYELTPWWRFPESIKQGDANSPGDDNPDLEKYLGHFEFRTTGFWHRHELSIMFRHNLRSEQRGAIELSWLIPISKKFKTVITAFNGYGETLIDYNHSTTSIGFGILLNSWL